MKDASVTSIHVVRLVRGFISSGAYAIAVICLKRQLEDACYAEVEL